MKKLTGFLLPVLLMILCVTAGCQKKGITADKGIDPDSVVTVAGEEGEPDISGVPAIITSSSAGCYALQNDGSMEWVVQLEQFTEILYLGELGKFTYVYKEEERSGDFMKCYVDNNGEMMELWILKFNVMENASLGVVLNTCLLYSKDKMDKITDKEVVPGTIVFRDTSYTGSKFEKIRVPDLGDTAYYIQSGDFSGEYSEVQVAMIYRAALSMGEGKEKQKRQLLQDAIDSYPSSPLIGLVEAELNLMDNGPMDDGMGFDEEALEGDGYSEEVPSAE